MSAEQQFAIGQNRYAITKLPTRTQHEIARRFSSVLVFIGDIRAKTEKQEPGKMTAADYGKSMLLASAQLPAADWNFVSNTSLGAVQRLAEGIKPTPVLEPTTGQLMFQDLTPADLCELSFRVLDHHGLIDFFVDPPSTSSQA